MSNRSSHVSNKDILLSTGSNPTETSKLDLVNRPTVTEQPRFKSSAAYTILKREGLEIFSPIGLPDPILIEPEVFGKMGQAYTNDPEKEVVECKVGDQFKGKAGYVPLVNGSMPLYAENDTKIHPMYRPSYFTANVDQKIMKQLFHFYFLATGVGPEGSVKPLEGFNAPENADYIWGDEGLLEVAKNNAFTSGTLLGQILRIKQNKDVATGQGTFHKNKGLSGLGYSVDYICKLLEKTLPLPKPKTIEEFMPLIYNIESLVYFEPDGDSRVDYLFYSRLPKYERETKAGMPYPQKTLKKEVPWSAYLHMRLFLNDLANAMQNEATAKEIKKVLKKWWFLSVFYIFPKAERYRLVYRDHVVRERKMENNKPVYTDKTETRYEAEKTRNIYSTPFITHMLASLLVNQIEDYGQLNVDNYDTPSLYKWTPYLGGMDRLMKKMVNYMQDVRTSRRVDSAFTLIYADNWYVLKPYLDGEVLKFQFTSEDLTKGESNATRDMQSAFAHYVLHSFFVIDQDKKKYVMFDSVMAYLMRVVIPSFFTNSTGLLGNMLIKFFGQASGNTWTFYTNHILTTILDNEYKKMGSPLLTRETREVLMTRTGIDFKVEFEDKNFEDSIRVNKERNNLIADKFPLFSENINPDFSGVRKPDVLRLDLLGYDAVYVPQLDAYVPVLNSDRLFKAVMLPKNFKSENSLVTLMYDNIRYNSLIMVGAWAYPVLHMSLAALVNNSLQPFLKSNAKLPTQQIASNVELPYDLANLATPEMMKYLGGVNSVPDDEFFHKLFTGVSLDPPPRANYHPIITFGKNGQSMLFVTPGMSFEQTYTDDTNVVGDRWGDIDEGIRRSTPYLRTQPTKTIGFYSIKTRQTARLSTVFNFANEVIMYNNAERLYLKSLDDDVYAKFKTKLTDPQKLNPTTANVYYDPVTGRTGQKGVKLPSEAPTLEDYRREVTNQGRNWQTKKRNLTRRNPNMEFGDDKKEREFIALTKSRKAAQQDFDYLTRKLIRFSYLSLGEPTKQTENWKSRLSQLSDFMSKEYISYMSEKHNLLNDKQAVLRFLKAQAAAELEEELDDKIMEQNE